MVAAGDLLLRAAAVRERAAVRAVAGAATAGGRIAPDWSDVPPAPVGAAAAMAVNVRADVPDDRRVFHRRRPRSRPVVGLVARPASRRVERVRQVPAHRAILVVVCVTVARVTDIARQVVTSALI